MYCIEVNLYIAQQECIMIKNIVFTFMLQRH